MNNMQQTDAVAEGRRIYVGNLRYSVTPTDIETVLSETGLGNFEKIHLSVDPISQRNPGYCFIEFPTREAAEEALKVLEGIAIYDRQLKVGPCHPRTPASRKYDNGRPVSESSTAQRWRDWRGGANSNDAEGSQPQQQQYEPENLESKRLYVGGLGPMLNQEQNDIELREIFAGFGIAAVGKRITPHETTRAKPGNHHYAFIDFTSPEEAERARQAIGGRAYGGGRLRVFHAKARAPRESEDLVFQEVGAARSSANAASADRANAPRESREERDQRQRVIMSSNNWRNRAAPAE